jgi:transcriptional regulator with XRE-family HTH domain
MQASLTQEELAERASLHRTYVGSAERGERNVSLRAIEQLARALRIRASALLDETRQ